MRRISPLLALFLLAAVSAYAALLETSATSILDWSYSYSIRRGIVAHQPPVVDLAYGGFSKLGGRSYASTGFGIGYAVYANTSEYRTSLERGAGDVQSVVSAVPPAKPTLFVHAKYVVFLDEPRELRVIRVFFTDLQGNIVTPSKGKQVLVNVELSASAYAYATIIIQVARKEGNAMIPVSISVQHSLVGPGVELSASWTPESSGFYVIKVFVWNGLPGQVDVWKSYAYYTATVTIP